MSDAPPIDAAIARLGELGLGQKAAEMVERWLTHPRYAVERDDLLVHVGRALAGDGEARADLEDAFGRTLPIGTGGRRGPVGPGPNRLNAVVLRETAQGLADALAGQGAPASVAVVYDTRRDSRKFAHLVASQLAPNGLEVVVVDAPRPTPLLSHMVRARGLGGGVMISASHNPPRDNGIKVYGPDGAQVLGATDAALMRAIEAAMDPDRRLPEPDAAARARIRTVVGESLRDVDGPYQAFVTAQGVIQLDLGGTRLRVVFTPLHGVGHTSVLPVLEGRGVDVRAVDRQCDPDGGKFSTVASANPEVPDSMQMAEQLAARLSADLVLATDPDADRLGAMACTPDGALAFIDGNRLGVLMLDHVLRNTNAPPGGWVLTTMVTSPLIPTLCRAHGVDVVDDLLVGFKFHAGMMAERPDRAVVFACEESHGYMRGNGVADKDGAVAALLLTECAALARQDQRTLFDELDRIWGEHGYHRERTRSLLAEGARGREAIAEVMTSWRATPPHAFAGLAVDAVDDRLQPRNTGSATRDLPGNVLAFELAGDGDVACRLVCRPSGTEPKLKLYALCRTGAGAHGAALSRAKDAVDALTDRVLADAADHAGAIMDRAMHR